MLLREHVKLLCAHMKLLREHMKLLREHVKLIRAQVKGITCARKKFQFFHHVPLGAPYVHLHKHEGRVCTCMWRNGLIKCAREKYYVRTWLLREHVIVIARAREVITCTREKYYVHT